MAYLLLANHAAGSTEDDAVAAAADVLRADAPVEVRETRDPGAVEAALAAADGRAVVVAGGDGSLHVAVRAARELNLLGDLDIGLLPMGTGNDFARGLGVHLEPVEAARQLGGVPARRLDLLATSDGEIVVNASHAGLGAAAAERSDGLKPALGPLAYPLGALLAGVRESGYQLTVRADGTVVHEGDTLLVGVLNAPYIGGGTRLAPPACPDDGELDVIVVSAVGAAARVAFGAALRNEVHLDRPDVLHLRARSVTIEGEPVAHDLDGEVCDDTTAMTYVVEPASWRFLAPARTAG